jgi:RNA 3'-terminal phosphate cyclase (ATP)
MSTLIDIDGSFGEGGGQILRSSLALSLLTGKPFRLRNIRAGRSKPGLQPQHLQSVRSAAAVGRAEVSGASKGSTELTFEPGAIQPGKYRFDIGTAGAVGLVLHTVYLPLALGCRDPSELTLVGGTHVRTSPCFHFLDDTWRRYIALCGLKLSLRLQHPGFYPRGGGVVEASIQPSEKLHGVHLRERSITGDEPVTVTGFSAVAGLPDSIARRQARRARYRLEQADLKVDIEEQTWEGGPGTVLALSLPTSPVPGLFFAIGERGKPAERVADEAADELLAHLREGPAAVDLHSADQLVLPLAFAEGPSEYPVARVTRHLTTNITVIGMFLDREIICEGEEGKPGRVRIV